jgi:hypothetical protein
MHECVFLAGLIFYWWKIWLQEKADQLYNSGIFSASRTWAELVQVICNNRTFNLCSSLIFMLAGFDPQQLNPVKNQLSTFTSTHSNTTTQEITKWSFFSRDKES